MNSSIFDICTYIYFIHLGRELQYLENSQIINSKYRRKNRKWAQLITGSGYWHIKGYGHICIEGLLMRLAEDIIEGEVELLGFADQSVRPR